MRPFAISLVLLVACGAPDDPEPLDLRRDFPAAPEGALVLETPDFVIPAYAERQYCWATTYDGEDVGIRSQRTYQIPLGHHVTLFGTTASERDLPDDSSWDCTSIESLSMTDMEPILIGGDVLPAEDFLAGEFTLPEGMAAPLSAGQRIVVQSHYLNTSADDILVRDQIQLDVVPEAEVDVWAAPLVNTVTDFTVPAGAMGHELSFDCDFDTSYTLLYIGGHMHEWGRSFRTEHTRDGVTDLIYDIPEWDPSFRDAPIYKPYADGELVLQPGDTFTTRCVWDNDTTGDLAFPQEMCVTFGMIYPTKVPLICDPS